MAATKKYPISALPLPPLSSLLTKRLTPDIHAPSVAKFRDAQTLNPSIQRRARLLSPECHFSHVSPYPVSFPYDVKPPEVEDPSDTDKGEFIERWLAERESIRLQPPHAQYPDAPLRKYYPENRDQPLDLIGISETGLTDCVPHLDVGDAFAIIGAPTLSDEFGDEGDGVESEREDIRAARKDLVDILSGHAMLMSDEFAPWSMRYSGHQFGSFAGQLGDGRAISVGVSFTCSSLSFMLIHRYSCHASSYQTWGDFRASAQGQWPNTILQNCRWIGRSTIIYPRVPLFRR